MYVWSPGKTKTLTPRYGTASFRVWVLDGEAVAFGDENQARIADNVQGLGRDSDERDHAHDQRCRDAH